MPAVTLVHRTIHKSQNCFVPNAVSNIHIVRRYHKACGLTLGVQCSSFQPSRVLVS